MANPSVTHTFTNATTADATQVNTNFTDLINGMTDGTKDFSISALTCAGTATLNGHVNLGNSTSDDLTITASLASTISIKTTNTYDVGSSTIGLRSIYFGSSSGAFSVRFLASATPASYTITLPTAVAVGALNVTSAGVASFGSPLIAGTVHNLGLAASVAASAMTIALKDASGSDPSATSPVSASFRSATEATGTHAIVSHASALSLVLSSGSTLGAVSAAMARFYVYLINNAGALELAVCGSRFFDDNSVVTTTAEGGAGAADASDVMYSTTARTGVACRFVGIIENTQATAGTFATAPSRIGLYTDSLPKGYAEYKYDTVNGRGSSNTRVRKFSNLTSSSDTTGLLTVVNSATLGLIVTANRRCRVFIGFADVHGTGAFMALAKNSTEGTTNPDALTLSTVVAYGYCSDTASTPGFISYQGILQPSHYIWPQTTSDADGGAAAAGRFFAYAEEI